MHSLLRAWEVETMLLVFVYLCDNLGPVHEIYVLTGKL